MRIIFVIMVLLILSAYTLDAHDYLDYIYWVSEDLDEKNLKGGSEDKYENEESDNA